MLWLILACVSALLSAAAAVVQKKILSSIGALEFSFAVSVCILALTVFVPFTFSLHDVPVTVVGIIAAKSALGACAFLCVMLSLEQNQISTALPLLGLTPAVAAMLSVPVFSETLTIHEYAAIGLMIAGIYLIERTPSVVPNRGRLPILAALLLFAVSSVADKLLVGTMKIDPWIVMFYQHIVYAVIFGLMMVFRRKYTFTLGMRRSVGLIAVAAVLTLAYRFAQLEASKLASVALVLAVKRTSILAASIYGGRLFGDERLGLKLAGAALIVSAGFLILRYAV